MLHLQNSAKKRYQGPDLEAIFLANYKKSYIDNKQTQSRANRKKSADYSKDTYEGSLFQHMMHELGTLDNPDRMALLAKETNGRKGKIWALEESKGDIEVAYDLVRINNYMIAEKNAFCATLDGIYTVLNRFCETRKPTSGNSQSESECEASDDSQDEDYGGRQKKKPKLSPGNTDKVDPNADLPV